MALRFVDGFDHYATADIATKWTSVTSRWTIEAGRNGNGMAIGGGAGNASITIDDQAKWTVGFAFNTNSLSYGGPILRFLDTSTVHFRLFVNPTAGTIAAYRNTSLLATSTNALQINTWYYIECQVTIGDAGVGNYEVRVNGTSTDWLPSTAADTRNAGNASANVIDLCTEAAGTNKFLFDDIYIADGQDGINDFLGDVKVTTLLPAAAGNAAQFSRSAGADNYALVDEASQDGDTTYTYSSTAGHVDTFDMATCTAATVLATQECLMARKDDSGARTIATVCRSGGADDPGTTESPGTSYVCYRNIREVDPNTDAAWTTSNLNAAEFGYKVVA
jgi:hypothetical protein